MSVIIIRGWGVREMVSKSDSLHFHVHDALFNFSDSSIKDGLFHEFKKFGQVTAVTVQGVGEDRKGIVFFKR